MIVNNDFAGFVSTPPLIKKFPKGEDLILVYCKEGDQDVSDEMAEKYRARMASLAKRHRILVVLNRYYKPWASKLNVPNVQTIYIDWFAIDVYRKIFIEKQCQPTEFTKNNNKFLCLVGKCGKEHRARAVWDLWKRNLIPHANISFRIPTITSTFLRSPDDSVKDHIEYTDTEWEQFKKDTVNDLDYKFDLKVTDTHYTGIPFNNQIYSTSDFHYVIESQSKNRFPWITEKTWLAIVNKMPFIILGDKGTLDRLESLGFKTYKEFLKYPDYNNCTDQLEKVHLASKNVEHWIENINSYDLQPIAEYNYTVFEKLVSSNMKIINAASEGFENKHLPWEIGLPYKNKQKFKPVRFNG